MTVQEVVRRHLQIHYSMSATSTWRSASPKEAAAIFPRQSYKQECRGGVMRRRRFQPRWQMKLTGDVNFTQLKSHTLQTTRPMMEKAQDRGAGRTAVDLRYVESSLRGLAWGAV